MKSWPTIVLPVLAALALASCNAPDDPDAPGTAEDAANTAPAGEAPDATTPALDDQPTEDVPPATASALLPPPPREAGMARLDGYGPLRVGMTAAEVEAAWDPDTPLGGGGAPTGGSCYYLFPGTDAATAPVAFMIENDTFVRYDARSDALEAPGGGHIGDSADDIRQRHAGMVESRPHKYVEGGEYLRVTGVSGQSGVLVFVVDAAGRVTGWHVGQAPQVDYVEGCS